MGKRERERDRENDNCQSKKSFYFLDSYETTIFYKMNCHATAITAITTRLGKKSERLSSGMLPGRACASGNWMKKK